MNYQHMAGGRSQGVDIERIEALVSVDVCFVRRKLAKYFWCDFSSGAIF